MAAEHPAAYSRPPNADMEWRSDVHGVAGSWPVQQHRELSAAKSPVAGEPGGAPTSPGSAAATIEKLEREVEAWKRLSRRWAARAREAEAKLALVRAQFEDWFPEARDE